MAVASKSKVDLRPITEQDREAAARFLHEHFNRRVPVGAWLREMQPPWSVDAPNAGFMLVADDRIVGAHLAIYSERVIDGRPERFCNLAAWCVLPEYRLHGLQLLKALLAQDGYHFTDLSPSGNVVGLNTRLGFKPLDTTTVLVPNLPWLSPPWRSRITTDPARIREKLTGAELRIYDDHATAAAAHHVVLTRGPRHCYVIWRKDRRKGLPLFASILYVSDPAVFRRTAGLLGRHLLLRHRIPLMLIERAVTDKWPRLSRRITSQRPKMYRSATLAPSQIDYLYSELVCLSW